ncbi:hypothetical protein [Streptomyces sp. NPDC059166]|uniref:hypothetical protein n=1 Tax=Streptomyces sp. NPDC059166 TaxID=3346752 RepID=UPI00367D4DE3
MIRPRRWIALLVLSLVPAAGCGIRATDVVEVGDAAVVEVDGQSSGSALLYFVHSGEPHPVSRGFAVPQEAESGSEPPNPLKVVAMLFAGPSDRERAAGLTTELPTSDGAVDISRTGSGGLLVTLRLPVSGLSGVARQQLVCTVSGAAAAWRALPVRVEGADGAFGPDRCAW